MRFSLAQVSAQEGWCRQHDRDFVFLDQRCILRRLKRIRISDDRCAFDQWVPESDGASKAVKKWQGGQDAIVGPGVEHDSELRHVADNIVMRKDDSFRFARRAT